jgi:hypothetical protein
MRVWLVALVLVVPLETAAQEAPLELPAPEALEAPCVPELEANRRALLEHDGAAGIWFHADLARCMLERLALLPAYARHVRLLEERIGLSDERDALRAREVALAEAEADTARAALEEAVAARRRAEEERDAWWRHPALWAGVGVVVVVLLEIVTVYALDALP